MESLPDVWNRLVSERGSPIVDLLAEQTHRLCVREPNRDEVEQFLSGHLEQIQIMPLPSAPAPVPPVEPHPSPEPSPSSSVTGKKPVAFTFSGSRYEVSSWKEMLVKLCEVLHATHGSQFDRVVNLRGRKRPYFSRKSRELREPTEIKDTDIYVETNLSAQTKIVMAKRIISYFEHNEDNFSYELPP